MKVLQLARSQGMSIDLGSAGACAVQWAPGDQAPRVATLDRDAPDQPWSIDEFAALAGALDRAGMDPDPAVIVAPKTIVRSFPLDLPSLPPGPALARVIVGQAAPLLGVGDDQFEWTRTSAPLESAARRSSTVAALPHAESTPLLLTLENAGVAAERLIAPVDALTGAIRAMNDVAASTVLLVDVGWSDTTIVGYHKGCPIFERRLRRLGYGTLADRISESLRCERMTARWLASRGHQLGRQIAERVGLLLRPFGLSLLKEIELSVAYLEQNTDPSPAERVLVCGGGSADAELLEWLSVNLSLPVVPFADAIELPVGCPPQAALAAGMAAATIRGVER